MTPPLLEVEALTGGFGANQVLHGVDLRLESGGSAVLLGLNGAGKSVTLKTISGLVESWGGSVRLSGAEILGLECEDRIRAGLGHVLQSKAVFPYLSVAENLRLGGAVVRDKRRYRDNIDRVHTIYPLLAERAAQAAGSLSGGQQAMLAVARSLMADPRLLLVDEPSAGLSPLMVGQLAETLGEVRRTGTALLLVEQNVGFGLELADEAWVLEKGRVVYHGATADLDRHRIAGLLGIGELLAPEEARTTRRPRRSNTAKKVAPQRTQAKKVAAKQAAAVKKAPTPVRRVRRGDPR
ncbi:MAG: ABC transporter ATP-binding protein [Acidimicrobiales bacterium]